MATKRIYQLVKEFERDDKEIIAFLTSQGIKVTNKLSAVSEETYNMLKAKFMAPPPPPEPEPAPEPPPAVKEDAPAESSEEAATQSTQPAPDFKKKKKKNKAPQPGQAPQPQAQPQDKTQPQAQEQTEEGEPVKIISDEKIANMSRRTQSILFEGIKAGNEFIRHYSTHSGNTALKQGKKLIPHLTPTLDTWEVLYNHKFEYPDASPARYWNAVAKLMTRAFKINNAFGMSHREELAKMREATKPVGLKYQPREIFTDEENELFEAQQKLLFKTFGHGAGLVNDNLYALKLKAERMKVKYERMDFLEYVTNPNDELRSNDRVPFNELAEAVTYALRGIARRYYFFYDNEERINKIIKDFFIWIDGYAKLKEQGAPVEKLEKYLELEKKFVSLVEFMSFDNLLLYKKKNKPSPFDTLSDLLAAYRDNMDDPDAERDFKYKARGVTNVTFKPKEFVFIYNFAGLEPGVDYRTPEMIAAAEAAKAAKEAEEAAKAAAEAEQKENPADKTDEA